MRNTISYLMIFTALLVALPAAGQFYNGHQMSFGKNRVQYDDFDWFFMRYKKFDTYFYTGGKELALLTSEMAYKEVEDITSRLDHTLSQRLIFVVYQNLSDFRQSNIGLKTLNNQYNIGGATTIVDNVVFLYIEGDQSQLRQQIRSAVTRIILNEILFGADWKNKVANNTLMSFPDWYLKGLVSYLSVGWNEKIENHVKDGIMSGRYEKINRLTGNEAIYAGHSIWYYIANTYGEELIPTILYLTRVSKNLESGFLYVLGTDLKSLSFSWNTYYQDLFIKQLVTASNPDGKQQLRARKDRTYQQSKISPDGKYLAYTSNIMGKVKIFIKDLSNGKTQKVMRQGHKLDQITDFSFPRLQWHPTGKLLGYITEKKGGIYYMAYNIKTKEVKEIKLQGFDKVMDFDYSDNGLKITFAGYNNGRSDIFVYNLTANTYQNLTADLADDYHPVFVHNSSAVLFQSKRAVDSLGDTKEYTVPVQKNRDLFLLNIEKTDEALQRLTNTPKTDEKQAYLTENDNYLYLSNETGVYNRYSAKFDSTISYIDTVTHYRYFMRKKPLTNYQFNVLEHHLAQNEQKIAESYYCNNTFGIYTAPVDTKNEANPDTSVFRKSYIAGFNKSQTEEAPETPEAESSDSLININAYEFSSKAWNSAEEANDIDEEGNLKKKPINRYLTSFYTSRIINQIDFGFLNASYQKFTGNAFYFNPGFNILLNIEAMDLFENYRVTGGFRFAGNFDSNEYLLSFENLESRLNKQYIFHRQTMSNLTGNEIYKTYLHQGMYLLRYPFNQVSSVQSTLTLRQDKQAFLTTDYQNLIRDNEFDYWGGLKLEYIFDNSRNLMININEGFRFKVFGEFYKQIDQKETDLYVVGMDFRYYLPIHRNLILATRFAASSSFGSAKLIYYLGGIDNWINISARTPMFDQNTRINPDENYVYQAVATNMRGFSQNVRNGNSFALINTEIRWPIISYFVNRPINSDFLNSFQVIGFFDVGSAWSGLNPYDSENAYENDIYENGPVSVIIDNNSYPLVAGYGIGVRTRLLGYFVRLDYARGIENNTLLPPMLYLSLNLDF